MQNEQLYYKYLQGRHWERHPTLYAERFADFLHEQDFFGELVDLGCGNGRDVCVMIKKGIKARGVDVSEVEIQTAREQCPGGDFSVQNIERLSFFDESIDAYFMINVAHYVDQVVAFQEIFRTLRPGGFFFVHFNLQIIDEEGHVDYSQNRDEIEKLIEAFRIIHQHEMSRSDSEPSPHEHLILELILQKPSGRG